MKVIRLMRLKEDLPCALIPERAITHGGMIETVRFKWERAHIRTVFNCFRDCVDEVHNDEVHGVVNAPHQINAVKERH